MHFVFDIDGTICFNGKSIAVDIEEALDALLAANYKVVFASARPIRDLLPVLPKRYYDVPLIGGNGAFVQAAGRISCISFDAQTQRQLLDCIARYQCRYLADSEWDFSYTGETTHPIYRHLNIEAAANKPLAKLPNLCKLVLFNVSAELLQELAALPVVVTQYKSEDIYDISPIGINKAYGLQQLQIERYIAFGNDQNDICLFEGAAYSVCVGQQEAGAYADCVIAEQEVAMMIEKLVAMIRSSKL